MEFAEYFPVWDQLTPPQQQALARAAGAGPSCRLVFVASPSLEAPRETLLYPTHLTGRQTEKLLRQLYDADALICGILPPSLLGE